MFDSLNADDFGLPHTPEEKAMATVNQLSKTTLLHNLAVSWARTAASLYFVQGVLLTIFWFVLIIAALIVGQPEWWGAAAVMTIILWAYSGVPGAKIADASKTIEQTIEKSR